jgi:hypothetical protein
MSAQREREFADRPQSVRSSNEAIAVKAEQLQFHSRIPMLCECGDVSCRELVMLTLDEYRSSRRERAFLTAPGHSVD